jgi:hypothetical protein
MAVPWRPMVFRSSSPIQIKRGSGAVAEHGEWFVRVDAEHEGPPRDYGGTLIKLDAALSLTKNSSALNEASVRWWHNL